MAEENKEDSLELTEESLEEISSENSSADNSESAAASDNPEIQNIEDNQEFVKKKKPNILKLALFGVVGLLALVLIAGVVLYFTGFFDTPEPEKKQMMAKSKIQKVIEKEEPKFSLKDINTKNLNKQLAELTNKSIMAQKEAEKIEKLENEKKILEEEKQRQKEALKQEEEKLAKAENNLQKEKELLKQKKDELEKQKEVLENLRKEALLLKEEMEKEKANFEEEKERLVLNQINIENQKKSQMEENIDMKEMEQMNETPKENIKETKTMPSMEDKMASMNHDESNNEFLLLINVAKIKGELYKNYLDSIVSISPDVKLCRDDSNIIEIYFGPFRSMESRKNIYNKLVENGFENSYEVELVKEEFNRRCNY